MIRMFPTIREAQCRIWGFLIITSHQNHLAEEKLSFAETTFRQKKIFAQTYRRLIIRLDETVFRRTDPSP